MTINQTHDDLKAHLKEQIEFLERSSKSYDEGFKSEAKRLSTVIRVLCHDTQNSTSLLSLLSKKDIVFYDTAFDYNPNNMLPITGLIVMRMGVNIEYVPLLDTFTNSPCEKVDFETWWNKIIFGDKDNNKLTRKDLILSVANKDGGAHVDPKLNPSYAALARYNKSEWVFVEDGIEKDFLSGAELASIRQVSYELLKSLKDEFLEYFSE